MALPGEQVPGHAACQLDQRRRPWRLVPRPEPNMRKYVRFMCPDPSVSVHFLAVLRCRDALLAKEVAAAGGPAT
jgi:hypothetical protein